MEWNPALSTNVRVLPAGYRVKIPADRSVEPIMEVAQLNYQAPAPRRVASAQPQQRQAPKAQVIHHRVQRGETLIQIAQRYGATVLLTSHYMEDVAALCPRVVVIDRGRLIYDGDLRTLSLKVRPDKRVVVRLERPVPAAELSRFGAVISADDVRAVLQVSAAEVSGAVGRMLAALPVSDLTVEDPPLEEVMSELFRGNRAAASG